MFFEVAYHMTVLSRKQLCCHPQNLLSESDSPNRPGLTADDHFLSALILQSITAILSPRICRPLRLTPGTALHGAVRHSKQDSFSFRPAAFPCRLWLLYRPEVLMRILVWSRRLASRIITRASIPLASANWRCHRRPDSGSQTKKTSKLFIQGSL